jgi:GT2 family glycosyltransferase
MNQANTPHVSVVVVTYGSRADLLRQVLAGLDGQSWQPTHVIVVDNGASPPPLAVIDTVPHRWSFEVIPMGVNRGSAAGFGAGMKRALEGGSDLVWLLDDDNVAQPSALADLLRRWQQSSEPNETAFAAMRGDRKKYVDAASGLPSMKFSPRNSFLGFSLFDRPGSRLNASISGRRPNGTMSLVLDVAIYGGLLIPRAVLQRAGFPAEEYFVYLDDRDFTTRITLAGGRIELVPEAIVKDVDDSWGGDQGNRFPALFNPSISDAKLYYTVRNAVHYERKYVASAKLAYFTNLLAHVSIGAALTLIRGARATFVLKRSGLLRRAVVDGWHGRLGEKSV